MTSVWYLPRPTVLKDVTRRCGVRFAYTYNDGETALVTGIARGFSGKDGEVTGLRVELDHATQDRLRSREHVKKALQADIRHPVAAFAAERITADPRTDSITAPDPELQPGDDGVFLMFEVTGDPDAEDGRNSTARDGWYTLHTAGIYTHQGGRQWLLQRDIWRRADQAATARAWAAHLFELPMPDCGQWRVRWGSNLTTGDGAEQIAGEFGEPR
jgi:hypothetical protein